MVAHTQMQYSHGTFPISYNAAVPYLKANPSCLSVYRATVVRFLLSVLQRPLRKSKAVYVFLWSFVPGKHMVFIIIILSSLIIKCWKRVHAHCTHYHPFNSPLDMHCISPPACETWELCLSTTGFTNDLFQARNCGFHTFIDFISVTCLPCGVNMELF